MNKNRNITSKRRTLSMVGNFLLHKIKESKPVVFYHDGDELPKDFPQYTFIGESSDTKNILCAPYHIPYIMSIKPDGKLDWYKPIKCSGSNFIQIDKENYGYIDEYAFFNKDMTNYTKCIGVVFNINTGQERHFTCKKYGNIPCDDYPIDNHLFYAVDAHNVFVSTVVVDDNNDAHCIIQQQKDDKVVWQFDTGEYPELKQITIPKLQGVFVNKKINDYAHVNSLVIDKDNNPIISFRNIGLIKINYETKKIMWVIGQNKQDFKGIAHIPLKQHCIQLVNNAIYVYDNGGSLLHSRCLKFELDEQTSTGKSTEFITDFLATNNFGSCIPINNHTMLISHGFNISQKTYVEEYDYQLKNQNFILYFQENILLYNTFQSLQ